MKNIKTGVYTYNNEIYDFEFGTDLTMAERVGFVNSVVDLVVDDLNKKYNSIIRDLIFDFYVIDIMTNIDTTKFKTSPAFLDDVEEFLENTNIIDIVKANAFPHLFDELNKAIDNSIEYITGIHQNPFSEALAGLVNTLEKKINEVDLDSMMGMAQKFAGMTEELTIDNVMKAYINSDVHQSNVAEIEESKKQMTEIAEDLDKAIKIANEEGKSKTKTKSKNKI